MPYVTTSDSLPRAATNRGIAGNVPVNRKPDTNTERLGPYHTNIDMIGGRDG